MTLLLSGTSVPTATPVPEIVRSAQAADSIKVVLSEILFAPRAGETTFVELANLGTAAIDLSSFVLLVDTLELPLPHLAAPVPRGGRVLIRFDGRGEIEDNVVHTSTDSGLSAAGGSVTLLSFDNHLVDRVAWGNAEGAIMPPRGGIAPSRVEAGSSFGRPPGAERPGAPTDWVIYPPDQVSPGRANPLPPVAQLLPINGAIVSGTSTELNWYPVPGAVRYRVQLAIDTTFAQPLLDQVVDQPGLSSGQLAAGTYWWRVQAIPADGALASWSLRSRIEFEGPRREGGGGGEGGGGLGSWNFVGWNGPSGTAWSAPVPLNVPALTQHKDTPMLLLESQQAGLPQTANRLPQVPHAWDRDHQRLDVRDPADNMNCAIASTAMINHFYGGDLAQDRIGYEVFSKEVDSYAASIRLRAIVTPVTVPQEKAPGPERDLNYGYGMSMEHIVAAGLFSLGQVPGPGSGWATPDQIWAAATKEIDAGRPLMGVTCCHAIVIRGYELRGTHRVLYINDPWSGGSMPSQYAIDLDVPGFSLPALEGFFTWPTHSRVARMEPTVWRDSDGDGVSDFDEIKRFHTNPNLKDSDFDFLNDKEDILSGIYEVEHIYGYAWNPAYGSPGRDFDADGKPTELDPDSDNGGCVDGDEDLDKDGFHSGTETGNFDQTDDECGNLQGRVSYVGDVSNSNPGSLIKKVHDEGTILVKLKREAPGSDHFIDDGSTYSYLGYARIEIDNQGCVMYGREFATGSGSFTSSDSEIAATSGNDGTLAIGAGAQVPGRSEMRGCNLQGSNSIFRGMAFPACVGVRSTKSQPGWTTYRFNCSEQVTLPDGSRGRQSARGYVRLK